MAETEMNNESLKKIQVVLHLEPKLRTEIKEMSTPPVEEISRDIIHVEDIIVVRKIDEGKKCIFDRPGVIVRRNENANCTQDIDYDLSKPSTSKQVVREVMRVEDDIDDSIDTSWIDVTEQKNNTSVINSLQNTKKMLKSKHSFRNDSRYSKKRNRSRSASNDRHHKKYRSSSHYSDKKNDFYDLSDQGTTSSISSDESISDHGYYSKKTNEYHDKNDQKRSSTPLNLRASRKNSFSRNSRRRSYSRKHNNSRRKSKNDDMYDELYEQYGNNKMYMNYLQMNMAMHAIQALIEILTSTNSKVLE